MAEAVAMTDRANGTNGGALTSVDKKGSTIIVHIFSAIICFSVL